MKLRFLGCLVAFATVAVFADMAYAVSVLVPCYSSDECPKKTTKQYCCPNGKTGTRAVCPNGWTMISGSCTRVSEDAGEDEKGYMERRYGICLPTDEEYDCYSGSDSSTVTIDGYTARCNLNPTISM